MHKWIIFGWVGVGGGGGGVAARISEIFSYKESGKWFFLYKESKSNNKKKKFWRVGGDGECG